MTLNFMIKISNVARRGFSFKSQMLFKTFKANQLKSVPPTGAVARTKFDRSIVKTKICQFHVTSPRNASPLIVLLLRYVAKAGAVISGRLIRRWWKRLSPNEREKVLAKIGTKKSRIAFAGSILAGCILLYYIEHIVEDPITKRKKFMMLNQKHISQIAEFEYQNQLKTFRSEIVPASHPIYRRVARVANHLLMSNSDMKEIRDKIWTVTVVDRPDITNAFALPHGKIFVFTGMLNICTNDDQLAIVLAHEISHSILCHVAESMSKIFLVEFILIIPSLIFWTVFPDVWAIFSEWITSTLAKIFIHLPFSRSIEKEADQVGMQLAAKSCYDVREAPIFWQKMTFVGSELPIEWLSTHPSHRTRQVELQQLVPQALLIRDKSKCSPLPSKFRI